MHYRIRDYFVLLLLLALSLGAWGQSKSFTGISNYESGSIGPIIKSQEIVGYYSFQLLDEINSKTNSYLLSILDANLNEIASEKLNLEKGFLLKEGAFNGNNIMLTFLNQEKKKHILKRYDLKGKEIKSNDIIFYIDTKSRGKGEQALNTRSVYEKENSVTISVKNKGFIHYSRVSQQKYSVDFLANDVEQSWRFISTNPSNINLTASYLFNVKDLIVSSVSMRENIKNGVADAAIIAHEISSGKMKFEVPLGGDKYSIRVLNGYFDHQKDHIIVLGMYYEKGSDVTQDNGQGLCHIVLDKTGKLISNKYCSWAEEVSKHSEIDEKGKVKKKGYLYFHNFIKTEDGKIFAIAEQYRKAFTKLVDSNIRTLALQVNNLFVFEFNDDFKLQKIQKIFKNPNTEMLINGNVAYTNIHNIAKDYRYLFDYRYSHFDHKNEVNSFCYLDRRLRKEHKKGEKHQFIIMNYIDGAFSEDKIQLTGHYKHTNVYPAKPGYILIVEYISEKKKVEIHLERVNY